MTIRSDWHAQNVFDLPVGKAHELWAPPEGGAPVSLGLLPKTGEQRRVLTPAQQTALAGAKQIAVSLEPEGGSPTGAPTGPVLLVARPSASDRSSIPGSD